MGRRLKYFFAGMSSVFTLFPTAPFAKPLMGTDAERLSSDWDAVGRDLQQAVSWYEQTAEENRPQSAPKAD